MKVNVIDVSGKTTGTVDLSEEVFGITVKQSVLHQTIVWQQAKKRAGTAKTKTRAEVAGGGKKPWKQKGTGRARAGTSSSPLWRHGGTAHGPVPKDWSQKLPKRVRKLAVRMALANRVQMDSFAVLDSAENADAKTKAAVSMLETLGQKRVLFVTKGDGTDASLAASIANIPNCKVLPQTGLNVYDILNHTYCVVEKDALSVIEQRVMAGR